MRAVRLPRFPKRRARTRAPRQSYWRDEGYWRRPFLTRSADLSVAALIWKPQPPPLRNEPTEHP